ncbi:hypothetical protein CLOP_g9300 [Closterium sp. NIES-67]|nr:hypothetical protein CLOP_g9300 [Closterium sp. NIES-67]
MVADSDAAPGGNSGHWSSGHSNGIRAHASPSPAPMDGLAPLEGLAPGDPASVPNSGHHSGHHNDSSGRYGARDGGGAPGGAGHARGGGGGWSSDMDNDNEGGGMAMAYDMTMPDDKHGLTSGLASPLIHSTNYEDDLEKGGVGGAASIMPGGAGGRVGGAEPARGASGAAGRGAAEFGRRTNTTKDVREHVKAVIQQNEGLTQPFVVRNLTLTYFLTVAVVILLSLGGQLAVHFAIQNSKSDATVVNVAGRQRMLSQLISKDSLEIYVLRMDNRSVSYYVNELSERTALWNKSHYGLWYGSKELNLPGTGNRDIAKKIEELTPAFLAVFWSARGIVELNPDTVTCPTRPCEQLKKYVDTIMESEAFFWKTQDDIVLMYQNDADTHTSTILILSWVLHMLVIVTLVLEGLFVFRPVLRHMQSLINERFALLQRSLVSEAENRGVSVLMMGYISHELQQPLASLSLHLHHAAAAVARLALLHPKAPTPSAALSPALLAPDAGGGGSGMDGGGMGGAEGGGWGGGAGEEEVGAGAAVALAAEAVGKARVCGELMSTVVGDVANLRNIELGRMMLAVELVDVSDLVQQVLSVIAPKVPEGVSLRVDVDPSIEARQLDKHRLQQVLLNLVDNAFRRTGEGVVVVRVKEGAAAHLLRVEVQDSGEGLSDEERQRMLDPVMDSSAVAESEGAGLALYVVKLLVDLQGGTFGMESEPGGDNLHWVELPAASAGPVPPTGVTHDRPAIT